MIKRLLDRQHELEVAVSATTRPQRPGEVNGREYWFLSEEEFVAIMRALKLPPPARLVEAVSANRACGEVVPVVQG